MSRFSCVQSYTKSVLERDFLKMGRLSEETYFWISCSIRNLQTRYRDVEARKILLAASFDVKTIQKVNFH